MGFHNLMSTIIVLWLDLTSLMAFWEFWNCRNIFGGVVCRCPIIVLDIHFHFQVCIACGRSLNLSYSFPILIPQNFHIRKFLIILCLWLFFQFEFWCSFGGLFQRKSCQCKGGTSGWSSASTYNGNSFDYSDACCIT